jgi:hypothetical protein
MRDQHTIGLAVLGILGSHLVPRHMSVMDSLMDTRRITRWRMWTTENHAAYRKRAERRHRRRKLAKMQKRHMRKVG